MEEPPHPPLLISLCAGLFVVLALIASADATLFGSDRFKEIGTLTRALLIAPMVFVAIGGACAVWAGNAAYNLAHRSWKLKATRSAAGVPPPWPWPTAAPAGNSIAAPVPPNLASPGLVESIRKARKTSAMLIWIGSACAIGSILALLVAFGAVVYAQKTPASGVTVAAGAGKSSFDLLGMVDGFASGASLPGGSDLQDKISRIRKRWCAERRAGRDGLLFVIGATDRAPLKSGGRQRFESNSGLAQSRAATVANLIFPNDQPNMIILPAGPGSIPADVRDWSRAGFAADRKVTLWAVWGAVLRGRAVRECPPT